jgi:biotin carboxyl carrier protein
MTFDIAVNGRSRMVSVERAAAAGRYRIVVDGRPHEIDAVRIGDFGLSLLLDGGRGASREVQVAPSGPVGQMLVRIDGRTVAATINGRRTGRVPDVSGGARGAQAVLAPMPGRVVRVLVEVGEAVAARQAVVVVEAMKMENELRAARDGRVRELSVGEGQSVDAGAVLMVVD